MKKSGLKAIIGKRIRAVVTGEGHPEDSQSAWIFLAFDDDTWFEIYGRPQPTSGVCQGDAADAARYAALLKAKSIDMFDGTERG